MTVISAENANALFAQCLERIGREGAQVSPRGLVTREVFAAHLRLTRPRDRLVHLPPGRVLNPAFAVAEAVWILSGSDEPWIYQYNSRLRAYADDGVLRGAYGPRLRRWGGRIDQLERVLGVLRQDSDSRRAVIQLYDPARDESGNRDVPCTLGFRFHLRDGHLVMSTTMRSQDVWLGLPYDVFTFTVLHELLAGWLGVPLGAYHHHIDSLHLYASDAADADQFADTAVTSPGLLPDLTVPWEEFDATLAAVRAGQPSGHRGWDTLGAVLRGYRLWTSGQQDDAYRTAAQCEGVLGRALTDWFDLVRVRRRRAATGVGR